MMASSRGARPDLQNIPIQSELGKIIRRGLAQPGAHQISAVDAKADGEEQLEDALRRAAQEVTET